MPSKTTVLSFIGVLLLTIAAAAPQPGGRAYDDLRAQAEKEYAEKSFSRAHEIYEQAAKLTLGPDEKAWVELRLADTAWRADVASPSYENRVSEGAAKTLRELTEREGLIGAEANESLGDFHATHPWQRNPQAAVPFYTAALGYWAKSDQIALARERYLAIVWKMTADGIWYVPRQVLVNAAKIAETPVDRAHAQFLLAQSYLNERQPQSIERAYELLDAIVAEGKKTPWYDDALWTYAQQLSSPRYGGVMVPGAAPEEIVDYNKALELARRLVREFPQGSEWRDDAEKLIESIVATSVQAAVAGTFMPDSDQEIVLSWRNTNAVELALTPIDLTRDVRGEAGRNWIESITLEGRSSARKWTYATNDTGDHRPGSARVEIEPRMPAGAYVLTAKSGSKTSRQLMLVTDAHILTHSANGRMVVFVSDVETGEPIAGARVRVWQQEKEIAAGDVVTGSDGLANVKVEQYGSIRVTAARGASRQAFLETYSYGSGRSDATWRIYAFTDRPAYRPEETVRWKFIARTRENEQWVTPQNGSLRYEIIGPRGEKVKEGTATLNAFGSFWSELPLDKTMALGPYQITFYTPKRQVGSAQLFRLEEYKLPEFLVTVSTPDGSRYRLGDTIEATIEASYYFGGPVANAEVEAVVYESPLYRSWYPWREYEWYWRDTSFRGYGNKLSTQTLHTDAAGRAVLRIDTPRDGTDTSYRIEARVVDASRREVTGIGDVNVMRQRYSVMAAPEHYVHRPGDSVSVKFKASDANDKPVRTTGTVEVLRRRWKTKWIDANGARIDQGRYDDEKILTTKLDTDENGEAELTFTPKTAGYYAVQWTSTDGDSGRERDVVRAETMLWVADRATTDIGYRQAGGLDLIVDRESVRAGETANALLALPSSGRWVLLTTAGDGILDTQVVHLDGTVKLVQLPVDVRHEPNFFVTASSVFDRQLATDTEQIVVPPVEHFLNVDVKADREDYEPRQEGRLTITTRDVDGKPVPAEVAVSLSDEAVTAIAQDPAGDPREFFFGQMRGSAVGIGASLQSQRYVRLQEQREAEREAERKEELQAQRRGDIAGKVARDAIGGVGAVAESITVTAAAPMVQNAAAPPAPPPAPVAPPPAGAEQPAGEVIVRSDFRSTALWQPDVVTDANGTATVKFTMPEALTTWRATARAATSGSSFGMGTSKSRTNLPLIVRLQSPRFFVAGDRATVSAVINNNTADAMTVTATLTAKGLGGTIEPQSIRVDAHGEARADWTVSAEQAGAASLRVSARGERLGDAMEKQFVVYEHGIDKLIARSGKLRGSEALVRLDLPAERRATELTVQVAPSLAVTLLDALPYLIDFPYGCTEQTMSRFLPAAVVARTLEKLGLDREDIADRVIPRPPNAPKGAGVAALDRVTSASMTRLYDMQHDDGSWGWWVSGPSDAFMTAYVVWGFSIARDAGLPVRVEDVERGASWLANYVSSSRVEPNDAAWILHALTAWNAKPLGAGPARVYGEVWEKREILSSYSRALLALTAHRLGDSERARVLVRNLEDGARIDRTPDQSVLLKGETAAETMATAHWGEDRFWWRWHEGPVETTAFVLQALSTIDPGNALVEPAMNWLVKNRRGASWNNTRDTAIAVLALDDYLQRSGELRGDVAYEVTVNGHAVATKTIAPSDVLTAPSRFVVDASALADRTQEIRIRRTRGTAPLYFSAEARFVSLEEPVKAAGNEIFVRREYFRLAPRPTLLEGVLYDRVPLRDGDTIASGERVEVVVTIDAKNDYDYLVFEDLKPGGLEAVEVQSGRPIWATNAKGGGSAWVYQELRDRKVASFIDHLPQGVWELRYTMRAETPGTYHALPLIGQAMYVPEVRANGDEVRVSVGE